MYYKYFYAVEISHIITRAEYIEEIQTGFIELDFKINDEHTLELATKCIWEKEYVNKMNNYKWMSLISFSLVDAHQQEDI